MKTPEEIIDKHIGFHGKTDDKWFMQASIKHYLETGKPNGSFLIALIKAIEEYAAQFKSDGASQPSIQEGEQESERKLAFRFWDECVDENNKLKLSQDELVGWLDENCPKRKPSPIQEGEQDAEHYFYTHCQIFQGVNCSGEYLGKEDFLKYAHKLSISEINNLSDKIKDILLTSENPFSPKIDWNKATNRIITLLKSQSSPIQEGEQDATVAMLDDIISWEKDLSEYKSLEGILRERYKITKR